MTLMRHKKILFPIAGRFMFITFGLTPARTETVRSGGPAPLHKRGEKSNEKIKKNKEFSSPY